ncbi:MAG TPA: hypothetical protein GXX42_08470 [Petrimonas sp.]|uniref:DUF6520 family protein n=1 Tax=Petrimonas sp. TaxID=2023866 RepID=UPI0017783F05|nr:hypothetical protein [Petrimonas sp.]
MKKFKQFILPAVIVLIGAGAAFATNAAKVSDSDLVDAYYYDNTTSHCLETGIKCATSGLTLCTWTNPSTGINYVLQESDGTSCGSFLYEP